MLGTLQLRANYLFLLKILIYNYVLKLLRNYDKSYIYKRTMNAILKLLSIK